MHLVGVVDAEHAVSYSSKRSLFRAVITVRAIVLTYRELIKALLAVPDAIRFPHFSLYRRHASQVDRSLQALFADGRRVSVSISCVEIAFVDSLAAADAVHVFKVVNFLRPVLYLLVLQAPKNVSVADLCNLRLALRA